MFNLPPPFTKNSPNLPWKINTKSPQGFLTATSVLIRTQNEKELFDLSLFHSLTKWAFFCLESESSSTVNAIHIISYFERSSALFLNDGQCLDTHYLHADSFQRQLSTVTNPSPAAKRVWSFLLHLTPSIYSGENQREARYVTSLNTRQIFCAHLKPCETERLTAFIFLTSGAPLKEKKSIC